MPGRTVDEMVAAVSLVRYALDAKDNPEEFQRRARDVPRWVVDGNPAVRERLEAYPDDAD